MRNCIVDATIQAFGGGDLRHRHTPALLQESLAKWRLKADSTAIHLVPPYLDVAWRPSIDQLGDSWLSQTWNPASRAVRRRAYNRERLPVGISAADNETGTQIALTKLAVLLEKKTLVIDEGLSTPRGRFKSAAELIR